MIDVFVVYGLRKQKISVRSIPKKVKKPITSVHKELIQKITLDSVKQEAYRPKSLYSFTGRFWEVLQAYQQIDLLPVV